MENIIQFNSYINMTFDELVQESNNAMKNINEQLVINLMKEFNRRLALESRSLIEQVTKYEGSL